MKGTDKTGRAVGDRPEVRWGWNEGMAAAEWKFNCGPGALCAVTGMTPAELRPHLCGFEAKGYTNPTLMFEILTGLGVRYRVTYRSDSPIFAAEAFPSFGLVRVQWGGRWTRPGVPMRVRYRHTHWAAVHGGDVFDVNAVAETGGWLAYAEWADALVPWLIRAVEPGGDGTWWPTHGIEVETSNFKLQTSNSASDGVD